MGKETDVTAQTRIERWEKGLKMASMHPLLGVGYANWGVADQKYFNDTGELSHNIFIECMSELGYVGLSVFILLIVSTVRNNLETMRISKLLQNAFLFNFAKSLNLSLLAYLVAGFFVTILFYPYFWINIAMTVCANNAAKKLILEKGPE